MKTKWSVACLLLCLCGSNSSDVIAQDAVIVKQVIENLHAEQQNLDIELRHSPRCLIVRSKGASISVLQKILAELSSWDYPIFLRVEGHSETLPLDGATCRRIAANQRIVGLRLDNVRVAPEDINSLLSLPNLIYLAMPNHTTVSDPVEIVRFPLQIMELELGEYPLSEASWKKLKELRHLRKLELGQTVVNDSAWDAICAMEGLERLGLSGLHLKALAEDRFRQINSVECSISGAVLTRYEGASLADLRQCKRLELDRCQISNGFVRSIAVATHLTDLSIQFSQVTVEEQASFNCLSNIRSLSIQFSNGTDELLSALSKLDRLEELAIRGNRVTDVGLDQLTRLRKLRSLSCGLNEIGDAGIAAVANLSQLRELDVQSTELTRVGLESIAAIAGLERVNVRNTRLRAVDLSLLGKLQNLRALNVGQIAIDENALALLHDLPQLETLYASESDLDDAALETILNISTLRELNIARNPRISDQSRHALLAHPQLSVLMFKGSGFGLDTTAELFRRFDVPIPHVYMQTSWKTKQRYEFEPWLSSERRL
jgi:Leucine-rich repeat (LRR) protein